MLCRHDGAANLKRRHHVECCLATSSHKLAPSFGCADNGLSGVGRHSFYLALLIGLTVRLIMLAHVVDTSRRLRPLIRRIPAPQWLYHAHDLARADGPHYRLC